MRFFSPEAGQRRRTALERLVSGVEQFVPPNLRPAAEAVVQMNPVQGISDAMSASGVVFDAEQTAEARRRAAVDMGVEMAMTLAPAALVRMGYLAAPAGLMETFATPSVDAAVDMGRNALSDAQYAVRSVAQGDPRGVIDAIRPSGQPQSLSAGASDAPQGLLAYHGSPHSFDKFDISKIGTGEGAQAYGYGLYFAENEKVARDYRDALTEGLRLQGKPLDTVWTDEIRERWPDLYKGLSDKDADTMDALIGTMEGVGSIQDAENAAASVSKGAERLLETRVKPLLGEAPAGSMYEVRLPFEQSDLLDYDKPVSQQPKILAKIDDKYGDPEIIASQLGLDFETATGGAWLQQIEGLGINAEDRKAASDWFKSADIQGIKYFDQGSRNTAEGKSLGVMETPDGFVGRVEGSVPSVFGPNSPQRVLTKSKPYKTKEEAESWINEAINRQTRNYVVFDDRLIEIVRKYGIAGAAALLGVSSADIEGALAQGMPAQPQTGLLQ